MAETSGNGMFITIGQLQSALERAKEWMLANMPKAQTMTMEDYEGLRKAGKIDPETTYYIVAKTEGRETK